MSSANMIGTNAQVAFGRNFTYTRDRSGSRKDLWGMPLAIHLRSVLLFSPI